MRINAHTVSPSAQDPASGEIGSPHEEMPLLQELACSNCPKHQLERKKGYSGKTVPKWHTGCHFGTEFRD